MRCLGEIEGRKSAERLVAYLLTEDIATHIESQGSPEQDRWEIWVREEDKLSRAVEYLREFKQSPEDPKYADAVAKATSILADKQRAQRQAAANVKRMDKTARPGMQTRGGPMPPMTLTLFVLCIGIGLLSGFGTPSENNEWGRSTMQQLSFVTVEDLIESGGNPAASIMRGELWRIITPIFLHGSPGHLAMNMFGLFIFGRILERLLGTPRYAAFVLVLAVLPNLLQGLAPDWMGGNPRFVGISGVIYGFLGYIWVRSSLNPMFGVRVPLPFAILAVGLIVVGLSGAVPDWPYADLCHLGGLLVGALAGYAAEKGS